MNNIIVNHEEKLTFAEWERIRAELKQEEQEEKRYFVKQKVLGGVLVGLSLLMPAVLHDITASVLLLPIGIGVMVTRDKVV